VANLLIVEDSQVTAHMVTRSLQSAGHKCRWAATGGQALEEIRDHPADLTILDYVLPDLNGMEVLKGILDLNPAALVVMVTGQGDETLAASVIKAGARDYVAKTGRFYEPLVHVVEQVLREEATRCALEEKARLTGRLQAQNAISFWMAHNFKNQIGRAHV
jgi:DNA-binding response OmpR family regulator